MPGLRTILGLPAAVAGLTLSSCNSARVGTVDRTDEPAIRLAVRGWTSHDLLTLVAGHLLAEHIGNRVELVTEGLGATSAWISDFENDLYDVDIETWQANPAVLAVQEVIEAGKATVAQAGFVGRSGLFLTKTILTGAESHPFADFYSFYASDEASTSTILPRLTDAPIDGDAQFCSAGWCRNEYSWISPACADNPQTCVEVIHASSGWDSAYFEQVAANADARLAFRYYGGGGFITQIIENKNNGVPQLFYGWEPSEFVPYANAARISFKPNVPGCTRDLVREATGPVECDYPGDPINRITSHHHSDQWKHAWYFLREWRVSDAELSAMLALTETGGGSLTVPAAACKIVQDWEADATTLAPFDCVMKPPANPVPGDIVLNENTLQCGPLSTYVEDTVTTQCLATDLTTEKANRERTRVRFALRERPTQRLATEIAMLTVKELLGYTVAGVELTNEPVATSFGDALVDVEAETWDLASGSAAHTAAKEFIHSLGAIGYIGRAGLYATSAATAPGAGMTLWWKFYQDTGRLTDFVRTGAVSHAGAATCTDNAWCSTDWTFVPSSCAGDASACTEVALATPEASQLWAEAVAENSNLKMTFAYYGTGLRAQVDAFVANSLKAVFFVAYPDPEFVDLAKSRISLQGFTAGCGDGHDTSNPSGSTVECDFEPYELQLAIRATLSRTAPEAVFALQNVYISPAQLDELMLAYNDATGTNKARAAVCAWASTGEHVTVLQEYAPECVSKPKDDPQQGDFVFRVSEMLCVEVACDPGQYVEAGECRSCSPGQYPKRTSGVWACTSADAGSFASGMMDEQEPCAAGFVSERGQAACDPCPAGFFASEPGSTQCRRCAIGSYAPQVASTNCTLCIDGKTTLESGASQIDECGCAAGSYLHAEKSMCEECPEGYICQFGADENATIAAEALGVARVPLVVRMGYHALMEDPMVAYRCTDLGACGPPENVTEIDCTAGQYKDFEDDVRCARPVGQCFNGMLDSAPACGRCPDGQYPGEAGKCTECTASSVVPFITSLLFGAAAAPMVYYTTRKKQGAEATALLATGISLGMLVSLMQIVGTTSSFSLPFRADISAVLSAFSIVLLDVSALNAECLATDAAGTYAAAWVAPYYVLGTAFVIWAASKVVNYNLNGNRMFSSTGQVFQTLYITFVSIGSRPLICYPHPSERTQQSSVQSFPSVICGTSEHVPMVALSVLSTALIACGFLVLCMWANLVARVKSVSVSGEVFLARFRFLFFRFTTTHWYWGTCLQLRSGALSFVPVIVQDNGAGQAILITVILGVYLACACQANPWKTDLLNFCDIAITILMLCFAAIAIAMSYPPQEIFDSLSDGIFAVLGMSLAVVGGTIGSGLYNIARHGGSKPIGGASKKELQALAKDWDAVAGATSGLDLVAVLEVLQRSDLRMLSKTLDMMQMEVRKVTGKSISRHSKRYRIASSNGQSNAMARVSGQQSNYGQTSGYGQTSNDQAFVIAPSSGMQSGNGKPASLQNSRAKANLGHLVAVGSQLDGQMPPSQKSTVHGNALTDKKSPQSDEVGKDKNPEPLNSFNGRKDGEAAKSASRQPQGGMNSPKASEPAVRELERVIGGLEEEKRVPQHSEELEMEEC